MSEINTSLSLDLRATLLDLERRSEQAAPGSEGAFADLLRTFGLPQPPTSAEPFEANALVGRATSPAASRTPESMAKVTSRLDACDGANPTALQLNPSTHSLSFARPHTPSEVSGFDPQLSAGPPVDRPPSALQQQSSQQLSMPTAVPSLSPRQGGSGPTVPKPEGNASSEKVRNLILEQAQRQASSSAVRIAIIVVESGVRVIARVGTLQETEKLRLKESIAALLAENGLTDAGVIIQTTPQSGSSSREG